MGFVARRARPGIAGAAAASEGGGLEVGIVRIISISFHRKSARMELRRVGSERSFPPSGVRVRRSTLLGRFALHRVVTPLAF